MLDLGEGVWHVDPHSHGQVLRTSYCRALQGSFTLLVMTSECNEVLYLVLQDYCVGSPVGSKKIISVVLDLFKCFVV